ncbi:uncharacterized protein DS421_14g452500 [Arachis hypogaea]|nr:uncharacterized protein DS421_14g452500 [Arachis hypogaea]
MNISFLANTNFTRLFFFHPLTPSSYTHQWRNRRVLIPGLKKLREEEARGFRSSPPSPEARDSDFVIVFKGLISAVKEVIPDVHHIFCV